MSELRVSHRKEVVRRGRRTRKKIDGLLPGLDGSPASGEKPSEPGRLDYRAALADWPLKWRERWGRRANALEDEGLSWRDAEVRAFLEVWKLRQEQAGLNRTSPTARN